MKIERKILLSNAVHLGLIVLIGLFAFQNMNRVLTKLRFVEIADDLNASFLEMRLLEKNWFLYRDVTATGRIRTKIEDTRKTIDSARGHIVSAIGERDLGQLEEFLGRYDRAIGQASKHAPPELEVLVRSEGKRLQEFSDETTHAERKRVNDLILGSQRVLVYSFVAIFLIAVLVSHSVSQTILRSVREIHRLAKSITLGNYRKIEGKPTNDELGAVVAAVNSMSEELSDREEELVQSKKLASLGILTAGVAHELTNPLNNISMIAQTYAELYEKLSGEDRVSLMAKVEAETERIREIVKNLLDFSRSKEPTLGAADANAVAAKSLGLVRNMLALSNIDARLDLGEGLPRILVDEHQIEQVLVNLLTNAAQAMSDGGRLVVSTKPGGSGGSVEIAVADTGKGIPPEHMPHVFDPFFSTKGEGGTGLGLSVSYGIVKNHRGDIRVESKPGAGTTFTIELPVGDGR